MDKHKGALREQEKLKIAMTQVQDKHNRRIQEMKEVCSFSGKSLIKSCLDFVSYSGVCSKYHTYLKYHSFYHYLPKINN